MRKVIIACLLAGMMITGACGQKENTSDKINTSQEKSEKQINRTISETEIKSLLKQHFENIADCSFTISKYERFHIENQKPAEEPTDDTPFSCDMSSYDVINSGNVKVVQKAGWFHLINQDSHQIADMASSTDNEFFVQKTADGDCLYGYTPGNGSATITPIGSASEMESVDILKEFTSDQVIPVEGNTTFDEKENVTGYDINIKLPYESYYKFFCYGSSLVAQEIPDYDKEKYADVSIHFNKYGMVKTIKMTVDGLSDQTNDSDITMKTLDETITISFDDNVPDIVLPESVSALSK